MNTRRRIVIVLESLDTALDNVPTIDRGWGPTEGHWRFYRYGGWGCRLLCPLWSWLGERWDPEATWHWGKGK